MKQIRWCECGREIRQSVDEICSRCRQIVEYKEARKDRHFKPRTFSDTTDHEVLSQFCSLLAVMGASVPDGPVMVYRPGEPGFDQIAMQYQ